MEQLTEMVDFEISFNRLQAFDVDILKWKKLNKLYLMYNNISRYNEQALWTHPELAGLGIGNNSIRMPISADIYMKSLHMLHLGENNMTIHHAFDIGSFPSLTYLYVNGNNLQSFPSESLKDHLSYLGIARCDLKSLPLYLSEFKNLKYLDARDNYLSSIDDGLKKNMDQNEVESYFSGNRILCKVDKSLDCEPVCSKMCWSRKVSSDGFCDVECNTEECKFDGGDCKEK
jgi:Leucine-rich repeat (LRR) protein